MRASTWLALLGGLLPASAPGADEAAKFFDSTKVQEIRLYFDNPGWYAQLFQAHDRDPNDPYFPARIKCGDVELPLIGARFKGNSSFRRNGVKKPFKLDFNEYDDNARFFGLKKLNLHNGDLQPAHLHEKLFLDFAGRFIPAMRAVHVRLYVNDAYYGLYLAVEQPDKTMMQSRFGATEDGNLWEAGESVAATMEYLGPNPASYYSRYELKTNEAKNDYSGLINLLDVLNNTPAAELPAKLEPILDIENVIQGMALNALFTNLESYLGTASEYFLYQRSSDNRFVHIHWDTNETFGSTGDGTPRIANPFTMDPFFLPAVSGPPAGGSSRRPLLEKLWAVPQYRRLYLQVLARFLREGFDETAFRARARELAALIRPHFAEDPNKVYTLAQFDAAIENQVNANGFTTYGHTQFVRERSAYLRNYLNALGQPADLRINEVASVNSGQNLDEAGEADPWIELLNLGPAPVTTDGLYLTDEPQNPTKYRLPAATIPDGGRLVIWADGQPGQGANHAPFRLAAGGGALSLFAASISTSTPIDSVTYGALTPGQSYARSGLFGSFWSVTATPTLGEANLITTPTVTPSPGSSGVPLFINEVMADNDDGLEDPDEPGAYEDWFEVYNAGDVAIDMSGMSITDNRNNPTKWQVPAGVTIPAGGFLVFIADGETAQGPLHTSWSLSKSGESVSLYAADGKTLIDSVAFGPQETNVSFGRIEDGGPEWGLFAAPTPGAPNSAPVADWLVNAASMQAGVLAPGSQAVALVQGLSGAEAWAEVPPWPAALNGVTVTVQPAAGGPVPAPVGAVLHNRVHFIVPEALEAGRATVRVTKPDGRFFTGEIRLELAAPGLFSADGSGSGPGLIAVLHEDAAGNQTWSAAFDPATGAAVPVSLGPEGVKVYLQLYGTGFRQLAKALTAQADGMNAGIVSAEAHGEWPGIDQVRIGPLPRSLAGRGLIGVTVSAGGRRSNAVTVRIE